MRPELAHGALVVLVQREQLTILMDCWSQSFLCGTYSGMAGQYMATRALDAVVLFLPI
jgi:hypothetical protein